MLARGKLKIKPNLSKAAKTQKKTEPPAETPSQEPAKAPLEASSEVTSIAEEKTFLSPLKKEVPSVDANYTLEVKESFAIPIDQTLQVQTPIANDVIEILSPRRRVAPIINENNIPRARLTSTCETARPQNKKKKFSGDEVLDTKKMRMMDMIYWNPKNEKALLRKKEATDVILTPLDKPPVPTVSSPTKTSAPQVKVGPDGKLVLDESSLYVAETQQDVSMWETIDDDRLSRKVTSLSFRNRLWRKGTAWTKKEDELFYELLRCTGTDFGLMHQFFPSRARNELKSKFNREERTNWEKMKEVMSLPAVFDESLRDRAEALAREIEKEADEKKRKKEKGFRVHKREKSVASEEWDESTANLVVEAEQIITDLQRREPLESVENNNSDAAGGANDDCTEITPAENAEQQTVKEVAPVAPKKALSASAKRILEATKRMVESRRVKDARRSTVLSV
ncbi:unnamed protein product [Auanema sp. JU1783]|nr:unnamed protein product [Auanema sp. JU1783]